MDEIHILSLLISLRVQTGSFSMGFDSPCAQAKFLFKSIGILPACGERKISMVGPFVILIHLRLVLLRPKGWA